MVGLGSHIARKFGDGLQFIDKTDASVGTMRLMPGFKITMDPSPARLKRELNRLVRELASRWEPHEEAGKYMVKRTRTRFGGSKTAEGQPWPKLSGSTIRVRRWKGITGVKPLIATRALYKDVQYELINVQRSTAFQMILGDAQRVTVTRISAERLGEARSVKARVHQGRGLGTVIMSGPGKSIPIPSRPYIGMAESEKRHVQNIFMRWMTVTIQKSARKVSSTMITGV